MSRIPSHSDPPSSRGLASRRTIAGAWLVLVLIVTLVPVDPVVDPAAVPMGFQCLFCGDRGLADGILNLLFFLPFGFLLGGRGNNGRVMAAAFLLSLGIELAQTVLVGRYPTAGDVVFNTLGAGLGSILWSRRAHWLLPSVGRGPGRSLSYAAVAGLVTLGFGLLLRPHHTAADYWGQWTADLGYLDAYDGSVVSADLSGIPVPSARFPDDVDARGALSRDFQLRVSAIAGTPPSRIAPILSIYDGDRIEIVLLGAQGTDLVWRERTWAKVWRLDQPDLRLPGALEGVDKGDPLRLAVARQGRGRCLEIQEDRSCGLGFRAGRTWSLLLHPEGMSATASRAADALWLFLLVLPLGFWSERPRHLVVGVVIFAATLVAATVATRLLLPSWAGWLAVACGALAGWLLRNTLVGRRPNGNA